MAKKRPRSCDDPSGNDGDCGLSKCGRSQVGFQNTRKPEHFVAALERVHVSPLIRKFRTAGKRERERADGGGNTAATDDQ